MIPRSCSGPVRVWGQEPWYGLCRKRTRTEGQAFGASSSGLALETFAISTGSFVFARLLGGAAVDLPVSLATVRRLETLYAVVYAVGSPALMIITSRIATRRLLIPSLPLFLWRPT